MAIPALAPAAGTAAPHKRRGAPPGERKRITSPTTSPYLGARERYHKLLDADFTGSPLVILMTIRNDFGTLSNRIRAGHSAGLARCSRAGLTAPWVHACGITPPRVPLTPRLRGFRGHECEFGTLLGHQIHILSGAGVIRATGARPVATAERWAAAAGRQAAMAGQRARSPARPGPRPGSRPDPATAAPEPGLFASGPGSSHGGTDRPAADGEAPCSAHGGTPCSATDGAAAWPAHGGTPGSVADGDSGLAGPRRNAGLGRGRRSTLLYPGRNGGADLRGQFPWRQGAARRRVRQGTHARGRCAAARLPGWDGTRRVRRCRGAVGGPRRHRAGVLRGRRLTVTAADRGGPGGLGGRPGVIGLPWRHGLAAAAGRQGVVGRVPRPSGGTGRMGDR